MTSDTYRLFLSYSHRDKAYAERLKAHFASAIAQGELSFWYDRMIEPGTNWSDTISREISGCDGLACLLSADFASSDYIRGVEMKHAFERLQRGEIDVFPIPINHVVMEGHWLLSQQCPIDPSTPVADYENPEKAWAEIVRSILNASIPPVGKSLNDRRTGRGSFRTFASDPYALKGVFVGRTAELDMLNRWLVATEPSLSQPILTMRAIGGMGKSALAWHWLQTTGAAIAEDEKFEGTFWWSFYGVNADSRHFADRAYLFLRDAFTRRPTNFGQRLDTIRELSAEKKILFILDGFERELVAFNRPDAPDDPDEAASHSRSRVPLTCVEPEVGRFLRNIASQPTRSRWLITTRVMPSEIVDLRGAKEIDLSGLTSLATQELFSSQNISGTDEQFGRVSRAYGGHGLTLSILARSLKRLGHTSLVEKDLDQVLNVGEEAERRARVLADTIALLSEDARSVLESMLYLHQAPEIGRIFLLNQHLPQIQVRLALAELRDLGLMADTDRSFTFEMHPVIREIAHRLNTGEGLDRIIDVFHSLQPRVRITSIKEARSAIDLCFALLQVGRYEAAYAVYSNQLASVFRAEGLPAQRIQILIRFLGDDGSPRLSQLFDQVEIIRDIVSDQSYLGRATDAANTAEPILSLSKELSVGRRALAVSDLLHRMIVCSRLRDAERIFAEILPKRRRRDHKSEPEILREGSSTVLIERAFFNAVIGRSAASKTDIAKAITQLENDDSLGGSNRAVGLHGLGVACVTMCDALSLAAVLKQLKVAVNRSKRPIDLLLIERLQIAYEILEVEKTVAEPIGKLLPHQATRVLAAAERSRTLAARFAEFELSLWADLERVRAARALTKASICPEDVEMTTDIGRRFETSGDILFASEAYLVAAFGAYRCGNIALARSNCKAASQLASREQPDFFYAPVLDAARRLGNRLL